MKALQIEYMEEVLKRYYKGETTLAEERELEVCLATGENSPGELIFGASRSDGKYRKA